MADLSWKFVGIDGHLWFRVAISLDQDHDSVVGSRPRQFAAVRALCRLSVVRRGGRRDLVTNPH